MCSFPIIQKFCSRGFGLPLTLDVAELSVSSKHRPTNHSIGVNISERKSGTKRTKKRKKLEVIFFHRQGRIWYCSTSSRRYTDFARATITRAVLRLIWPSILSTAVCAWSRSNSRKNCDRITAMERHARKTLITFLKRF